jgi:hypothetical protein
MNHECMTAPRAALFIDGASLSYATKNLGFEIDFKRLCEEFQLGGFLVRAHYYAIVRDSHESTSIRPLIDWLCKPYWENSSPLTRGSTMGSTQGINGRPIACYYPLGRRLAGYTAVNAVGFNPGT